MSANKPVPQEITKPDFDEKEEKGPQKVDPKPDVLVEPQSGTKDTPK